MLQAVTLPTGRLEAGDRLEPCPELEDVGDFDNIDDFPTRVLFWRSHTKRCPATGTRSSRMLWAYRPCGR